MPKAIRRMWERNKVLGLTQRQCIYQMHVRQGMSLMKIADALELSCSAVYQHWEKIREEIYKLAVKTPEQQAEMRDKITSLLWTTVDETMENTTTQIDAGTGEEVEVEAPVTPQQQAIRLKALDQLARAYGLYEAETADTGQSYSAPDDVVQRVRAKMLELNGRPDLAKKLLDKPAA